MSISRRRGQLKQPSAVRRRRRRRRARRGRKPRPQRQQPRGRRTSPPDRRSQREPTMSTRTELERTTGARRVVAALVLVVAFLGGWTIASAGKPRDAKST